VGLAPPPELGELARQEWDRVVQHLAASRVLTHLDRSLLAVHCEAWATWITATLAVAKKGAVITAPSGYPVQSPWVSIANKAAEVMRRTGAELGLSPAARAALWKVEW
jgi:P27 family predicted phage terminase small subunit